MLKAFLRDWGSVLLEMYEFSPTGDPTDAGRAAVIAEYMADIFECMAAGFNEAFKTISTSFDVHDNTHEILLHTYVCLVNKGDDYESSRILVQNQINLLAR